MFVDKCTGEHPQQPRARRIQESPALSLTHSSPKPLYKAQPISDSRIARVRLMMFSQAYAGSLNCLNISCLQNLTTDVLQAKNQLLYQETTLVHRTFSLLARRLTVSLSCNYRQSPWPSVRAYLCSPDTIFFFSSSTYGRQPELLLLSPEVRLKRPELRLYEDRGPFPAISGPHISANTVTGGLLTPFSAQPTANPPTTNAFLDSQS